MSDNSTLFVLGIGFVLGLKHATDPDHIVAVTTFVGEQRQLRRACAIGLFWGLGHAIALSVAGLFVVGLKIPISEWLADRLELAVAGMLVVLGAKLIASVHTRWHEHHHYDIHCSSALCMARPAVLR
jgi:ABC-type nickel/cobalt efflux system permease component RcnA